MKKKQNSLKSELFAQTLTHMCTQPAKSEASGLMCYFFWQWSVSPLIVKFILEKRSIITKCVTGSDRDSDKLILDQLGYSDLVLSLRPFSLLTPKMKLDYKVVKSGSL